MTYPFGWTEPLTLRATTPAAGVALTNGTPTILSWTAPNDGQLHQAVVVCNMDVTSAETGGDVTVNFDLPNGTNTGFTIMPGGQAAGFNFGSAPQTSLLVKAGTSVVIAQYTALTAGAATLWARIWGL